MLEVYLHSLVTRQRLRAGPAADHIDGFADWLDRQGYKPTSIGNLLRYLAGWTDWLLAAGFTARDLIPGLEACRLAIKTEHVRYRRGPNHQSVVAASAFIRFLQQRGELPPLATSPSAVDLWPVLGEFRAWMRSHRGLTDTTLDAYQRTIVGLLDALGSDARVYSAEALRAFVLDRASSHGIHRAKSIANAVRS